MNRQSISPDAIAEAAIRCFDKFGPQRTSMADIADEAGISRQTIYRFFDDRPALVQYILNKRIAEMGRTIAKKFSAYKSLREALVEGSLLSIREARKDRLYSTLVATSTDHSLELFFLRGTPEIREVMLSYWNPLIEKSRAAKEVSNDLSTEEIMEWIRHVHTTLVIRDDKSEAEQRAMLQRFFVPSIIRS